MPIYFAVMGRPTALALLALLLGLSVADGIWCADECERAARAAGGGSDAPAALAGTCLYCPPGVALARAAMVAGSMTVQRVEIGGAPDTSSGVVRPIEHPPRAQ